MTSNNNKCIFTNEIRQLLFVDTTFLSLSNVSIVFNISYAHSDTNLPNRCFFAKADFSIQIFTKFTC